MKIIVVPQFIKENPYIRIKRYYFDALLKRGASPMMIPVINQSCHLEKYIEQADGLLLSGGIDVDPYFYSEQKSAVCQDVNRALDRMSFNLIALAVQKGIAIFGICRGLQLINVYFKGSLYQDLLSANPQFYDHAYQDDDRTYFHTVSLTRQTKLAQLYDKRQFAVNSIHHQGIKKLGKGVIASAHSQDGLVEAIEVTNMPIFGVQWHPEALMNDQNHAKLFDYFIDLVGQTQHNHL